MNFQRRALHVPCKMHTRETNAGPLLARGCPRWKSLSATPVEKKISSGLNKGERRGGKARTKREQTERRRARGRWRKRKERERERERERRKKKTKKKEAYLRGSALNLRCDGAVHRAAPSILFPPLDLWRTMHYVNCERAASDRGKSNNPAARVAAGLLSGIRVAPIGATAGPDVALRRR